MHFVEWNEEKNQQLKQERGVGFEDVQVAVDSDNVLAITKNPNEHKYPHQRLLIVVIRRYAYIVPFVRKDDGTLFLKTIYPSRVATKKYLIIKK